MTKEERFFENEGLIYYMIDKFNIPNTHMDYEDLVGEGRLALWKAVVSYKDNKDTAFSTYACNVIKNHLSVYLNKKSVRDNRIMYENSLSLDTMVGDNNDTILEEIIPGNKPLGDISLRVYFDNLRKTAKTKSVKIFFDFYDGMTAEEITKKYKLKNKLYCGQYVSAGKKMLKERIIKDFEIKKGEGIW